MEKKPIQDGIYAITAKGKTSLCCTEHWGTPQDVATLLHEVNQAVKRHPDHDLSEPERLLMYSRSLLPISTSKHIQLFQPMEREEFDFVLGEIRGGGGGTAHYELDYDQDRFAVTSWDGNELKTLSAPLHGMIDAYDDALFISGNICQGADRMAFLTALEQIAVVGPAIAIPAGPELTTGTEPDRQDQTNDSPEGFSGFTGPSM